MIEAKGFKNGLFVPQQKGEFKHQTTDVEGKPYIGLTDKEKSINFSFEKSLCFWIIEFRIFNYLTKNF